MFIAIGISWVRGGTCVITVVHMHLEPYIAGRSIVEHNIIQFLGGAHAPLGPPILTPMFIALLYHEIYCRLQCLLISPHCCLHVAVHQSHAYVV